MKERIDLTQNDIFHQIRQRDDDPPTTLENYYNKIKLGKNEKEKEIGLTFSINGRNPPAEIEPENPKCYAKIKIYKDKRIEHRKYFIKQDRSGYIYDPLGAFEEGCEKKLSKDKQSLQWDLREVKPQCFWMYLLYLQTRKEVYLYQAARFNT